MVALCDPACGSIFLVVSPALHPSANAYPADAGLCIISDKDNVKPDEDNISAKPDEHNGLLSHDDSYAGDISSKEDDASAKSDKDDGSLPSGEDNDSAKSD